MTWRRLLPLRGWIVLVGATLLLWSRPLWFPRTEGVNVLLPHGPSEAGILRVHYHERPPYYVTTATGVTGLCAAPVRRALANSGVPHRWHLTPPRRQLFWLQLRTREAHAAVGWFRLPEREGWARFSDPVYRDGAWVAVVRRDEDRVGGESPVPGLLRVPGWIVLRKAGYSYGSWLEGWLAEIRPVQRSSPSDAGSMLQAVARHRADCVFMAREEAECLLGVEGDWATALRVVTLTDSPPGPERHVMFGRGVPESWIRTFNEALNRELRGSELSERGMDPPALKTRASLESLGSRQP